MNVGSFNQVPKKWKVGKSAVQEAFNALKAYDTDVAVTATNQLFSLDAVNITNKVNLGFKMFLWDKSTLLQNAAKLPIISRQIRKPREYQQAAIDAVFAAIDSGQNKGLITLATGLGKIWSRHLL